MPEPLSEERLAEIEHDLALDELEIEHGMLDCWRATVRALLDEVRRLRAALAAESRSLLDLLCPKCGKCFRFTEHYLLLHVPRDGGRTYREVACPGCAFTERFK